MANCHYEHKWSAEEKNSYTSTETDVRNSLASSTFCSVGCLKNRFQQTGSFRRFRCKSAKVSSSLIALSPRFEGLKVAAAPRGKRDLTVFDFRVYSNPDRTETGDFVGPLSQVVFGSTHPFHRSLVSVKRFRFLTKLLF